MLCYFASYAQSVEESTVLEVHMKGTQTDIERKLKAVGFVKNKKANQKCLTGILAGDTVDIYITKKKIGIQTIKTSAIKIFQVYYDGSALAHVKRPEDTSIFLGPVVKLEAKPDVYYYDDQIIKIYTGEELQIIGTYVYEAKNGTKTVPVVEIFRKSNSKRQIPIYDY